MDSPRFCNRSKVIVRVCFWRKNSTIGVVIQKPSHQIECWRVNEDCLGGQSSLKGVADVSFKLNLYLRRSVDDRRSETKMFGSGDENIRYISISTKHPTQMIIKLYKCPSWRSNRGFIFAFVFFLLFFFTKKSYFSYSGIFSNSAWNLVSRTSGQRLSVIFPRTLVIFLTWSLWKIGCGACDLSSPWNMAVKE